ncbi:MAG: YqaA family protein [Rhodospirillaceae bacterium]
MIRRLYDWTLRLAGRRDAMALLAIIAFLESSIFPIPPDVMILPMVLAAPQNAWKIATIATVASVLGGIAGYAIGLFMFDTFGLPLLEIYGYADKFSEFQAMYSDWGAWIVFGAGLTPFPFKVITIASGAAALDPLVFIVAALLSRGLRFYLEAALLWKFGPPIRTFVEKRLGLVVTVAFVLLVSGFAAIRFIG